MAQSELIADQLDALVLRHLHQHAVAVQTPEEELRALLLSGDFGGAAAALHRRCPQLAHNQWLQFQLKKHQFMRVAALTSSKGGIPEERAERLQEALELAKRELAPLALDAYVEAFSEFKQCMLALVFGGGTSGGDSSSGTSGTSSTSDTAPAGDAAPAAASGELQDFAGMVARAARQECSSGGGLAAAQPSLAELLRYLLLLHQHQNHSGFHPHWWPDMGAASLALCKRLLLPQRDALPPPAMVDAGPGLHAGGVRETDVQALRTSLGCDREEAVALLRRSEGSAGRALSDALQAAHIDEALLAELAEEYAASRGLQVPSAAAEEAAVGVQHPESQRAPAGGAAAAAGGGEAMQVDEQPAQSGHAQQQAQQMAQQQRPSKVARKEAGAQSGEACVAAPAGGHWAGVDEGEEEALLLPAELSEQQLRRLMRRLESLLTAGKADDAVQQLDAAEPAFLAANPAAAFALHRCCFLQKLAAPASAGGGTAAALVVVRQRLSPLVQQHPALLQSQLKAALRELLPLPSGEESGGSAAAAQKQQQQKQQQGIADALAAVRAALRPRCQLREPRLQTLLRELLSLHAAHFKLQRCQDRFAAELGIPALKAGVAGAAPSSAAAVAGAAAEAGEAMDVAAGLAARQQQQQRAADVPVPGVRLGSDTEDADMEEDGSDSEEEEGGDAGVPEQAILTVCEFTGLPRHTAIELLLVHGGDATAVLAHMFP
ncbi:hypothetical protein ABPG75_013738 [Micractinium tetrahymenae]